MILGYLKIAFLVQKNISNVLKTIQFKNIVEFQDKNKISDFDNIKMILKK